MLISFASFDNNDMTMPRLTDKRLTRLRNRLLTYSRAQARAATRNRTFEARLRSEGRRQAYELAARLIGRLA